ncbi:MAG: hypothetical protein AB8B50_03980 [Pirellulaceae bacterium]
MKQSQTLSSIQPLIGPFNILDSQDGVDATLNINCLTTGRWILSLYYWDLDELPGKASTTRSIAAALNRSAGHSDALGPTNLEAFQFHRNYPAPFASTCVSCEYEGPMVEIRAANGNVLAYRKPCDSIEQATKDAESICQALNIRA